MKSADLILCKTALRFMKLGQQTLARIGNPVVDEFDTLKFVEVKLGHAVQELIIFVEQQEGKQ